METDRPWLFLNKLTLNTSKTKYMLIGNRTRSNKIEPTELRIGNDAIEKVPTFKYLGVFLDETLNFEYHLEKLYNKTFSEVGVLCKVRDCLDQKLALTLYKSLIIPHLDYCNTTYVCANKDSLVKPQLVQNKACRIILMAQSRDHIDDMYEDLNILNLHQRRELHLALQCHTNVYPEGEQNLTKFFVKISTALEPRITWLHDGTLMKIP